jgi:hypothetical protein
MDPRVSPGAIVVQNFRGDPASAWRHADLVAQPVIAHHRTHGVGAVVVAILGRAGIEPRGIEPVVVVSSGVRTGRVVAAIPGFQRRVRPVYAGVHPTNDHTCASYAKGRPDLGGADLGDVPFYVVSSFVRQSFSQSGFDPLAPAVGANLRHLWPGGQGQQCLQVAGDGQAIEDPEGLVCGHLTGGFLPLQVGDERRLRPLGCFLQSSHYCLTAPCLNRDAGSRAQVGRSLEIDDVARHALGSRWLVALQGCWLLQLLEKQRLDLEPHRLLW